MSSVLRAAPAPSRTRGGPAEETRLLYERHGQRVFTFCHSRLRNREEAQDAAQTTFIYALRSLQRGIEPEFELAWLLKIADNVCRTTRRSATYQARISQVDVDELADSAESRGEGASERVAALRDALATLPENQQRAILLREWQGLSYADIAHELGLSVAAVETLLFRARRGLASRLERVKDAVLGLLDFGSAASSFRSFAQGWGAKVAVAAAGTALVAAPPVVYAVQVPARSQELAPTVHRTAAGSVAVGRRQQPRPLGAVQASQRGPLASLVSRGAGGAAAAPSATQSSAAQAPESIVLEGGPAQPAGLAAPSPTLAGELPVAASNVPASSAGPLGLAPPPVAVPELPVPELEPLVPSLPVDVPKVTVPSLPDEPNLGR